MRWEFQHWEDSAVGESSSTFPLIALYIGHPGERYTDIPVFRKASLASVVNLTASVLPGEFHPTSSRPIQAHQLLEGSPTDKFPVPRLKLGLCFLS